MVTCCDVLVGVALHARPNSELVRQRAPHIVQDHAFLCNASCHAVWTTKKSLLSAKNSKYRLGLWMQGANWPCAEGSLQGVTLPSCYHDVAILVFVRLQREGTRVAGVLFLRHVIHPCDEDICFAGTFGAVVPSSAIASGCKADVVYGVSFDSDSTALTKACLRTALLNSNRSRPTDVPGVFVGELGTVSRDGEPVRLCCSCLVGSW